MHWIAMQALAQNGPSAADDGLPADVRMALVWSALQFTERVAQVGQAVVLEVSGSNRLFGGREHLVEQILAASVSIGPIRSAQADTSLLALAQLQIAPADFRGADRLPLFTLPAVREHLPTLERLGCIRWGDLRGLPRGGVTRRFGAPLLDALDRAYGLKPEVYDWLTLPDVFDMKLELLAQVEAAPALVFAARRLLAQLQIWLQARQFGIVALELAWEMDARRNTVTHGELLIRTAAPTRDMQHMQRLLAENLARISLPAPVLYLRLRSVEAAILPGKSDTLLPDDVLSGDSWHQLLERLSARLGPEQVLRVQGHADHRPERMQRWVTACTVGQAASSVGTNRANARKRKPGFASAHQPDGALYPTWLLAEPIKLAMRDRHTPLYQGPLALLAGPQRLEAAWWDVVDPHRLQAGKPLATLRDYFLARSEHAGLLWIYRERLPGHQRGSEQGKQATQPRPAAASKVAVQAEAEAQAESHWYLHGLFG